MGRQRTAFYEHGLTKYVGAKSISVGYADVKWFSLSELDVSGRGIRQSAVNFCTRENVVFGTVAQSPGGRTDQRILRVKALTTAAIAARMEKELAERKSTDWVVGQDNQPALELRADGVTVTKSSTFVPFSDLKLSTRNGQFFLSNPAAHIFEGSCGMDNFYPGLAVLEKRLGKTEGYRREVRE